MTTTAQSKTDQPHPLDAFVKRRFLDGQSYAKSPLDMVVWSRRSSKITNPDGSVVFEMHNIEAPEEWSQLAVDIVASKYFRKGGLNGDASQGETSVRQVVYRIAHTIRRAGEVRGYFKDVAQAKIFEDELMWLLVNQYGAFNSPVWFNCGLFQQYDIEGSGGNFAWDESTQSVVETKNAYEQPQLAACFIQSVNDDLMSIYDLVKNEARLFKHGSGTGSNFSAIRGKQEKLSGGGTSSGLMSFLEVFDRAAGATKSGGTTRRAAKMVCLDLDHPEIVDFIEWKMKEERKAQTLIAGGYASDFNGDAYHTVSGQNSNNSVRVTDEFMCLLVADGTWSTRMRTTNEVVDTFKARDLWDKIVDAAWHCADPGIQFDTTINNWHTCSATARINASNPCSEFVFNDDTACNLASLNLTKFVDSSGKFDIEGFRHAVGIFFIAQEILVDFGSYPTREIAQNSHDYRPLGLGYANLGTLLMTLGVPYDSEIGRCIAAAITSLMTGHAYHVSARMAELKGPFTGFAQNRIPMLEVIARHTRESNLLETQSVLTKRGSHTTLVRKFGLPSIVAAAGDTWAEAMNLGAQYGFRNAQATVLAPTGTIGLLMDCDTTGIEPDFALVKYKKLAGGGSLKIVNRAVSDALSGLGYSASQVGEILEYVLGDKQKGVKAHDTIEGAPHLKPEHYAVFDCANRCGEHGARFIQPMAHIKMMAAVQPFLSGAISKTVNLPNEATREDIAEIYLRAWEMGLKAVAVYRDGCKASQPLSSKKDTKNEPMTSTGQVFSSKAEVLAATSHFGAAAVAGAIGAIAGAAAQNDGATQPLSPQRATRRRLPARRRGFTQEARVGGHKLFLRTGEYEDGKLGEIFVDMHKEGAAFRSLMNCFAIAVSLGLQHGVSLEQFVEQFTFTRFEPQGPVEGHANVKFSTSIVDYIFRVLGVEYLKRYDLAQVQPTETDEPSQASAQTAQAPAPETPATPLSNPQTQSLSKMMGDAPLCDQCGHITVRNASCYRCLNCGASMGCS